tara:strand:+ start:45 stop:917 length:873 start_codon:yes stop_codon:yes gene_type:complete
MGTGVRWQMILKGRNSLTDDQWESLLWQMKSFVEQFSHTHDMSVSDSLSNLIDNLKSLHLIGIKRESTRKRILMSINSILRSDPFQHTIDSPKTWKRWVFYPNVTVVSAKIEYRNIKSNRGLSYIEQWGKTQSSHNKKLRGSSTQNKDRTWPASLTSKGKEQQKGPVGYPSAYMVLDKHAFLDKHHEARQKYSAWLNQTTYDDKCCRNAKLSWLRTRRPRIENRRGQNKHPIMELDCNDFLAHILNIIAKEQTSIGDRRVLTGWWYCEDLTSEQQNGFWSTKVGRSTFYE